MEPRRADTDFRPQAELIAVIEPGRGIHEHGTGINLDNNDQNNGATINFTGVGGSVQAKLTSGFSPDAFVNQATFANGHRLRC